jgi:hypothetical protein
VYLDDCNFQRDRATNDGSRYVTARVIHQLVDYYTAVGLVSYASVVNRLVIPCWRQPTRVYGVFGGGGG